MPHEIRHFNLRLYMVLGIVYLALLCASLTLSINLDLRRAKERFLDDAHHLEIQFSSALMRNQIALDGFSAMMQADNGPGPALDAASRYAKYVQSVHATGPRLGIARAQTDRQRVQTVKLSLVGPGPDTSLFKPGVDLAKLPELKPLLDATPGNRTWVSPLLNVAGGSEFVLARKLQRNAETYYVMVFARIGDLVPSSATIDDSVTVSVAAAGAKSDWFRRKALEQPDSWSLSLFPCLEAGVDVGSNNPLFHLTVAQQLDWRCIDWRLLTAIGLGALFAILSLVSFARAHHRRELERLEEGNKLFQLANFDPLTGLPNRQLFQNRLEQAMAVASRQGSRLAVLFLDLDGFKTINDFYGHAIGDKVLVRAGRIFEHCIREIDTVSRFGGDEFVILLQNVDGRVNAKRVAAKIRRAFDRTTSGSKRNLPMIGTSIGIAVYPDDAKTAGELVRQADQDMYRDKCDRKTLLDSSAA